MCEYVSLLFLLTHLKIKCRGLIPKDILLYSKNTIITPKTFNIDEIANIQFFIFKFSQLFW